MDTVDSMDRKTKILKLNEKTVHSRAETVHTVHRSGREVDKTVAENWRQNSF